MDFKGLNKVSPFCYQQQSNLHLRPPLYNGNFCFGGQSIRSLLFQTFYNGHFCFGGQSIHSLLFQPFYHGHLSTMAESADSPYVHSCFSLSTVAIFFCPQGGQCGEVQLYNMVLNDLQYTFSHHLLHFPLFSCFLFSSWGFFCNYKINFLRILRETDIQ